MKLNLDPHYLSATSPYNFMRVLARNKFRISFRYIPRLICVLFSNFLFYPFHIFEKVLFSGKIKKAVVAPSPVFIIGHWRSGTTYMHNLFFEDKQFACPSTYQCLMPGIFLTGKGFLRCILNSLLPDKRPVDNVKMGADHPQEEEFAMHSLCVQSYFQALCFPRSTKIYFNEYAILETKETESWEKQYKWFLKKVTYANNGKPLVVKNPTNTVRIKKILKMYPDARFIYLHRDKEQVLNSTFNLYKKLLGLYTFQTFSDEEIEKNLLWLYDRTLGEYQVQKGAIPDENLIEIEYSNLVAHPLAQLEKIYSRLGLRGFERARDSFCKYIDTQKSYQPNTERFLKTNISDLMLRQDKEE